MFIKQQAHSFVPEEGGKRREDSPAECAPQGALSASPSVTSGRTHTARRLHTVTASRPLSLDQPRTLTASRAPSLDQPPGGL